MRMAINAIASTAGGGKTYLFHLTKRLNGLRGWQIDLWVPPAAVDEYCSLSPHIQVRTSRLAHAGFVGRLLWEQLMLPRELRGQGVKVLLCLGNFCPFWPSVPVVLLSANALYFCRQYLRDLLARRHYGWAISHLLRRRMAVWSARAADAVFTPTRAMAEMLGHTMGRDRGPDRGSFHSVWFGHHQPTATATAPDTADSAGELRFLVHSFYNYFRNFETVFHALALLRERTDRPVRLLLSTRLEPGLKLGGYDTSRAYHLLRELDLTDAVTCLGQVPYDRLGAVFASVDGLIAAGYVESFSFTVVEGMAAGLPVLVSDIPAHREVGGDAVLYFPALDAEQLSAQWLKLVEDASLRHHLAAAGSQRARRFDWGRHFDELFRVAEEVAA